MTKRILSLLLILCLLLPAGCGRQDSHIAAQPSEPLFAAPAQEGPHGLPRLSSDRHGAYMKPSPSGFFRPDGLVHRGEFCKILYSLLENPIEGHCSFTDIRPTDDCYEAVAGLAAWGVLTDAAAPFHPLDLLSRAQLVTMLSAFYPIAGEGPAPYIGSFLRHRSDYAPSALLPEMAPFSDIAGHWAEPAIRNAVARGWVEPGENFFPDTAVTRAELCRILNAAMGRQCDEAYVLLSGEYTIFPDVPCSHPDFGPIMEACYDHRHELSPEGYELWAESPLEPGFHRAHGHLYYVEEDGRLLRNDRFGVWEFDATGRYTTGLSELDARIVQILEELGTDDMSSWNALKAAYRWTVDHEYIHHPDRSYGFDGVTDRNCLRALKFMNSRGGVCYDYAATFGYLARALGYKAYIVSGQLSVYREAHGWVVIPENGFNYIYDPEMESAHPERHGDLDLFRTQHMSIYSYWYTPWW